MIRLAGLAATLLAAACSSSSSEDPGPGPVVPMAVAVGLNPFGATIEVGETVQFTAIARGDEGEVITGRPEQWSSGDLSVAIVSDTGLVTGVGPGFAEVLVSIDEVSAGTQLEVRPETVVEPPVLTTTVNPGTTTLRANSVVQMVATVTDQNGNPITEEVPTWSSSDSAIASVDSGSGLVSAITSGTTTIKASFPNAPDGDANVTVFTGFTGPYEAKAWSVGTVCGGPCWTNGPMTTGQTSIDPPDGDTDPITCSYTAVSPGTQGLSNRTARFATVATGTGQVTMGYQFTGIHGQFNGGNAELSFFSGANTFPEVNIPTGGFFVREGTVTIDVVAGEEFGIIVGGSSSGPNQISGDVVLRNFSGPYAGDPQISPQSGASDEADFSYSVDLGSGTGVTPRTATFSMVAPVTGAVSFDWLYEGFHASTGAVAELTVFANNSFGAPTLRKEVNQETVAGSFTRSGTVNIGVEASHEFGIIVGGENSDSTSRLTGTVTISNLNAP